LADPSSSTQADASANTVAVKTQIDESVKPLQSKLEERAKQANEEGLKDAAELLKKIEEGTHDLVKKDDNDRHDAMSKLNDLAEQLEQRREKLAEGEKLKDQLAALKNLPAGPADKLGKDLKNGDLSKAIKEIEKLQAQMASGELSKEKQKELAEQLNAMKNSLDKIADAHQKLQEDLQKKLDQAQKSGDKDAAQKLEKQLAAMQQKQPQMDQLRKMASMLGQAGKSTQEGNMQQAQAALAQMSQSLAQTQQEIAEMQMLETTLDEIDGTKMAMNGMNANGQGMDSDRRGGKSFSDHGLAKGAEGDRPETAQDTKFYDSKVKQDIGKGSAVITGLVEGPNSKGQAVEEIKSQMEAAKHDSADPLTGQVLPRQQRDHVQQYFDAFRKGE
jgi:DNA repair exonuclease SbcCD ATPase subunit